jgi:hypothetical protein
MMTKFIGRVRGAAADAAEPATRVTTAAATAERRIPRSRRNAA